MTSRLILRCGALAALVTALIALPSSVFAQGSLTPPGAPAPLFKTLQQVEPRTPISALPFVISNSGSFYVVSNLTGVAVSNGITIAASDVTLDLSGFTLVGLTNSGDGINISGPRTNVAIRNGTVRGWGGSGIDGTTLFEGSFLELRALANSADGFSLGTNGLMNLCTADRNGSNGIVAGAAATIQNCGARGNGVDGYSVTQLGAGTTNAGAQIINSFAQGNLGNGFTVTRSMVLSCYSANNGGSGIDAGTRSTVSGCKVMLNPLQGIRCVSGCQIIGNNIVGAGATLGTTNACILSVGGSGNRFEGNHMMNHDNGMFITGSSCFVFKNTVQGIATNLVIASFNTVGPTNTVSGVATNHPWANFIE